MRSLASLVEPGNEAIVSQARFASIYSVKWFSYTSNQLRELSRSERLVAFLRHCHHYPPPTHYY